MGKSSAKGSADRMSDRTAEPLRVDALRRGNGVEWPVAKAFELATPRLESPGRTSLIDPRPPVVAPPGVLQRAGRRGLGSGDEKGPRLLRMPGEPHRRELLSRLLDEAGVSSNDAECA